MFIYNNMTIVLLLIFIVLLYVFIRLILYIHREIRARQFAMVPLYVPVRTRATGSQKIPRIIYQTMKTSQVPINMKTATNTWINLNPEYQYLFYTDEMCREFLAKNFHPSIVYAYNKLVPGAFKADLWRYAILYKYGGVYADIDMIAKCPLRDIISPADTFIGVRDNDHTAVYNAFICCIPGHPFIKAILDFVVNASAQNFYGRNSLHPTGPLAFGQAITQTLAKDNPNFELGDQNVDGYQFKILDHPPNSTVILNTDGKICIQTKYDSYYQDMTNSGLQQVYHDIWLKRKIYRLEDPKLFSS